MGVFAVEFSHDPADAHALRFNVTHLCYFCRD